MSIIVLTLSILSTRSIFPPRSNAYPDAYEVIKEDGYPMGLLPTVIIAYTVNRCTGFLEEPCNYTIDAYLLRFDENITGITCKDEITNIRGVRAKIHLWSDKQD